MHKAAVAVAFALSSSIVQAASDGYYECTRQDGSREYSIYKCAAGREQRHIGGKEVPRTRSQARERSRPVTAAVPRTEARPSLDGKLNLALDLASYKCVGKSGDLLYTDASDRLAFEVYHCTQIPRGDACDETRAMLARDPLAVVSNKLLCP